MNEQVSGQLRQLLQILGTLLTAFGVLKPGIADTWVPIIMQVVGPLMMIGGVVWSYKVNTPAALVASVDALAKDPDSPVKAVVVENTMEGRSLANEMPGGTTVVAGTPDAKAVVAKPVGATS